ncbi:MAG TPA: hypothetical protein VKA36_02280 [Solirubrobacterales bacterium]|nr:hypothetical protein [Solirubrobacterales bacterium]
MSDDAAPVLVITPGHDGAVESAALAETVSAFDGDPGIQILVAGPAPDPLPAPARPLAGSAPAAVIALAQPGDRPDPAGIRAAAAELVKSDEIDVLIGVVTHGADAGSAHRPPATPVTPAALLSEARVPPASVTVDAREGGPARLEAALEALGQGRTAAGMLELLASAEIGSHDRVVAHVAEDPAAGWWSDERGLAELAELARSDLAAEHGLSGGLRRRALNLAFNERPVLGRPWAMPDLLGPGDDPERLRELIDDLVWALERQADSLLVLEGEWERQPIPPSPETGEVIDTELFDRDSEIRRLRQTEGILREQLADLHERLRSCGRARERDAEAMRGLREQLARNRPAAPGAGRAPDPAEIRARREREGSASMAVRAWRRLVPARLRTALWRVAPGRSEAIRRRALGVEKPPADRED